ncbi:unnamed protein product [Cochlearia groenlandica]
MENSFPGFEMSFRKDDCVFRRSMSCRLKKRAPCPLLLPPRPTPTSAEAPPLATGVSASAFCSNGTDLIPLLSPLVLPSMLQPNHTTTSH